MKRVILDTKLINWSKSHGEQNKYTPNYHEHKIKRVEEDVLAMKRPQLLLNYPRDHET